MNTLQSIAGSRIRTRTRTPLGNLVSGAKCVWCVVSVTDKCDVKWDEISDCRSNLAKDNRCITKHGKVTCVAMYEEDHRTIETKLFADNHKLEVTKHRSNLCIHLLLISLSRHVWGQGNKESESSESNERLLLNARTTCNFTASSTHLPAASPRSIP